MLGPLRDWIRWENRHGLRWDGQIVVLDGIHRLLKASLTDRTDIPVRVLAPHRFDAIAVPAAAPVTVQSLVTLLPLSHLLERDQVQLSPPEVGAPLLAHGRRAPRD